MHNSCSNCIIIVFLLTAGTARDKLRHVYNRPAYSSPCSNITFCEEKYTKN